VLTPRVVPCGRCIGCRLERSRQWALRCVHEASLYERNTFITLTYDPENLPPSGTLVKKDFQDFMKRLRRKYPDKIRYFHCGEYGEQLARPHYHACLFNFDFADKLLWKKSDGGDLYVSESLNEIWGLGLCVLGSVTFDSAAYVARYVLKKHSENVKTEAAYYHWENHYVDRDTGLIRDPEYITMSRGGRKKGSHGIGASWMKEFAGDVYPEDSVVVKGIKMRPPKYYDKIYDIENHEELEKIKMLLLVR